MNSEQRQRRHFPSYFSSLSLSRASFLPHDMSNPPDKTRTDRDRHVATRERNSRLIKTPGRAVRNSKRLGRNQQLQRADATSPRGAHLNYFRKYTPTGRQIAFLRRGRSACNYATSHNSDLLPRDSIVRAPSLHNRYRDTLSSMLEREKAVPSARIFPVARRQTRTRV